MSAYLWDDQRWLPRTVALCSSLVCEAESTLPLILTYSSAVRIDQTGGGSLLRSVTATRYVTPLREGGSLPAIVEADDDGMYVLKFRGAGQGPKALIAELVAGEIGRALGLPVPELVFVELDPVLSNAEPDPEIQDLLKASAGLNLALDYLPGALAFAPAASPPPDPELAARVVWFDAYVTNVDAQVIVHGYAYVRGVAYSNCFGCTFANIHASAIAHPRIYTYFIAFSNVNTFLKRFTHWSSDCLQTCDS